MFLANFTPFLAFRFKRLQSICFTNFQPLRRDKKILPFFSTTHRAAQRNDSPKSPFIAE
jgi:hypothetical protein